MYSKGKKERGFSTLKNHIWPLVHLLGHYDLRGQLFRLKEDGKLENII